MQWREIEFEATNNLRRATKRIRERKWDLLVVDQSIAGGAQGWFQRSGLRGVIVSPEFVELSREDLIGLGKNSFISWPFPHFDFLETLEALVNGVEPGVIAQRSSADLPMQGALREFPFDTLLFKLFDTRFSGRLIVRERKSEKVIYFLRGFPVSSSSNTHSESLGTLLIKRGHLNGDQLKSFLQECELERQSLGELLVQAQVLDKETLWQLLAEQVQERVLSCFSMGYGHWEVHPGANFVSNIQAQIQNPIELIFLGIRRFEETNALATKIQQRVGHFVVPTTNFPRLLPYCPMGPNRRAFVRAINGQRRLGELLQIWGGEPASFFPFFWALHNSRMVFLSQRPISSPGFDLEHILQATPLIQGLLRRAPSTPKSRRDLTRMSLIAPAAPVAEVDLEAKLANDNYFALFDLSKDASAAEIEAAVTQLTQSLPAKELEDDESGQQLQDHIRQAAAVLLDEQQRVDYLDSLAPKPVLDLYEQSLMLFREQRLQEALELLRELIQKNPAHAHAATLAGRILFLLSRSTGSSQEREAIALLKRAVVLDDTIVDAYISLAEIYTAKGEGELCRQHLNKALALNPSHQQAKAMLANLHESDVDSTQTIGSWMLRSLRETQD